MNYHELESALRKLQLRRMANMVTMRMDQVRSGALSPDDLLTTLVEDEVTGRAARHRARRIRAARFRRECDLDSFQYARCPEVSKAVVDQLATGQFVRAGDDLVLVGERYSGKSYLAQAIGRAVVENGIDVGYQDFRDLLDNLANTRDSGRVKMKKLCALPLLIIELKMKRMQRADAERLRAFIVKRRLQQTSTMFISTRPVDQWTKAFGDTEAVAGMLVQLGRAHVLRCGTPAKKTDPDRVQGTRRGIPSLPARRITLWN